MISWITNFLTSIYDLRFLTTDGRNSTSPLQLHKYGADNEVLHWPRQEKKQATQWAEENDKEEARPPYLYVRG